ncbi:4-amino-4-deoxy-L-arabinose transferase [Micromonospora nigra]|uniref:4-amino-4-deoxy-L-arabinose transferase n=1 Tax=Micromonospora nigra TaxID=145857 RepID=A0A1C6SY98_9ACTN|nr:glycosyltransferase family 39 protein [Micromonospora nigra]SCL34497.1 4-amino-4-deoxy-L-arabinose transferase [Micromonospora nigra]
MTSVTHDPPLAAAPAGEPTPAPPQRGGWPARLALAGVCLLAGLLYVWDIGVSDYGNSYYSAAVKSMTTSPTNFLFGAFDPYGVVSTDKPPMSLWPQALSVLVFGFHSWALLLPQVIEGVLAVFLLHRAVRIWAGERVALLAALILAVTPITVAINRDNNTDALLVLLLVAAAYTFTRAVHVDVDRSRTWWLMSTAFLIGCGFLTKWMEAWLVVPGFALAYLLGSTTPVRRRITDLLAAGGVLTVSSFWWPALHDLWPGERPYMGASTNGLAMQVIFGYNGFGKIFDFGQEYNGSGINVALSMVGMGGGIPHLNRMFIPEVGGQISWLLPFSLLVLAAVGAAGYRRLWHRLPGDRLERNGWLVWGSWMLVTILVFSFVQGIWHPYYTTLLGPAVAAVSAAGLAVLWRWYRQAPDLRWTLLPLAIVLTAAWAVELSSRDASWHGWTRWVVLPAAAVAVVGLALARRGGQGGALARPALALGVAAMLLTPTVWSVGTAVEHGTNGGFPSAGPPNDAFNALLRGELAPDASFPAMPPGMAMPPGAPLPPGMEAPPEMPFPPGMELPDLDDLPKGPPRVGGLGGPDLTDEKRAILDYAVRNSGDADIALAVEGGGLAAAAFIINSEATVIGMGGYLGADDAPSVDQLQRWVAQGKLRYVLSAAPGDRRLGGIAGMGGEVQQQRVPWVQRNCQVVDPAEYGGTSYEPGTPLLIPSFADAALYRCGQ